MSCYKGFHLQFTYKSGRRILWIFIRLIVICMSASAILEYAKRIKALSRIGLTYTQSEYDIERYTELESISHRLMEEVTGLSGEKLSVYFSEKKEYVTPKVDIRAVVFNDRKEILLVKESADGLWSLPGGWADVGFSPSEVAVKEVFEESGWVVTPLKLLAALDSRRHPHPPTLDYIYKLFIQCRVTAGGWKPSFDILDGGFFPRDQVPPLSAERVVTDQIELMFAYADDPDKAPTFD
jgi:ADP-ribose pyrophosphatase YjhB (NUDIX family)